MQSGPAPLETESEQELLDGLPIPAAKLGRTPGQPLRIERANDLFRRLAAHDERLRGPLAADLPLLGRGPIAAALGAFLDSDNPAHQFEAAVGTRQLQVRLARLSGSVRCLLTIIDRTAEYGPERSYRSEPFRDRLTGLPDRHAFAERTAEILNHPNFERGSHAVLSVELAPAPEEELVLAAARRLLSALRAGDLLARTGPSEFRILMRLDRGPVDGQELAERLRAVLATPFRLSACEARPGYAVGCTPLDSARAT